MSSTVKIRKLGIEIALLILLLIIGFAVVQAYRLGPLVQEERQAMDASRKQFETVQKAFQEAQQAVAQQDPSRSFFRVLGPSFLATSAFGVLAYMRLRKVMPAAG